jgi:SAM-dependent methyltransferase
MSVGFARTDGRSLGWEMDRFLGQAKQEELSVLERAVSPVLDVGCGPGRHVVALARMGVTALGVDISQSAVTLARSRGAPVLERSIFERIPAAGRWASALLLDGNVGIGGNPEILLSRIGELLRQESRILVEVDPPGTPTERVHVRLNGTDARWTSFAWAIVGAGDLDDLARRTGFVLSEIWRAGGRWFGCLTR